MALAHCMGLTGQDYTRDYEEEKIYQNNNHCQNRKYRIAVPGLRSFPETPAYSERIAHLRTDSR